MLVDINKTFYKSDQLKAHFYKPRDNIHLSPSGTRGLLGCINQYTNIVENFKQCAYPRPFTQPRGSWGPQFQTQPRQGGYALASRNRRRTDREDGNNAERCFKCGLTNHKTYECHHKNQLQCRICNLYGHKDSVCWDY